MGIKVMLVDDSPFSRTILAATLEEMNCQIVGEADSLETLIQTYQECRPDIVMMDIAMPGADGFECTKALRLHDPAAKVIMCSSMKDEESEAEAKRVGAAGYIQKPWTRRLCNGYQQRYGTGYAIQQPGRTGIGHI
jgi:DNA-binding NarL/FixJ family response regulator